jgi:4-amino-4-deoxy-L-arabinose transferase-like glycosyltransferase
MSRLAALSATILFLAALLTAPFFPLIDPDEGYYPATAAESVDAGRGWDLQFNGKPRWDKPVLAYALIEEAFAVFGRNTTAARLPSALEGGILVLIVGVLVGRLAGRRAGGLSAAVLATTLGVQIFSRVAHPEIGIVLAITTTQLLIAVWLTSPPGERSVMLPLLIGLAVGFGLLAKGPVAMVLPLLAAAAAAPLVCDLRDRWRETLRVAAIVIVVALAIAAPWYAAMTIRHGMVFIREALWQHNFGRYMGQAFQHRASPLFFVLPTAIGMLPWTALLPAACNRIRRREADTRSALRICMGAAAATAFLFYSLSASKLASYALVFLPPLSVLVGVYLDEELSAIRLRISASDVAVAALLFTVALMLLLVPAIAGRFISARVLIGGVPEREIGPPLTRAVIPVALVLFAGCGLTLQPSRRGRVISLCAVGVLVPLLAITAAAPVVREAYPWQRFAPSIAKAPGPVWVETYRAPSLTFYANRRVVRLADPAALDRVLQDAASGWLIVERGSISNAWLSKRVAERRALIVDRTDRLLLVRLRPTA